MFISPNCRLDKVLTNRGMPRDVWVGLDMSHPDLESLDRPSVRGIVVDGIRLVAAAGSPRVDKGNADLFVGGLTFRDRQIAPALVDNTTFVVLARGSRFLHLLLLVRLCRSGRQGSKALSGLLVVKRSNDSAGGHLSLGRCH